MRRMSELPENDHHLEPSESLPGYQPVYDDTYRPSGGEFGPGSGLEPPAAVGFGSDGYSHGGGDDYRLGGGGYGSDGGPETPYGAGPGRGEFLALRPEETNNGLTEMCDTPRQHLDTSEWLPSSPAPPTSVRGESLLCYAVMGDERQD